MYHGGVLANCEGCRHILAICYTSVPIRVRRALSTGQKLHMNGYYLPQLRLPIFRALYKFDDRRAGIPAAAGALCKRGGQILVNYTVGSHFGLTPS